MKHNISDELNRRIKNYNAFPSKSGFVMRFNFMKRKGKMVLSFQFQLITQILTCASNCRALWRLLVVNWRASCRSLRSV